MTEIPFPDSDSTRELSPFLFECSEKSASFGHVYGPINGFQLSHEFTTLVPGNIPKGVADQVDNATLNNGTWENGTGPVFKPTNSVHGDEAYILDTTALDFIKDLHPGMLALGFIDP